MPDVNGEQLATALIRALPSDLVEQLLSRMGPTAERLRANLLTNAAPASPADLDTALTEFFDLHRILGRGYLPGAAAAGEYRPVAQSSDTVSLQAAPDDPIEELKKLSTDRLIRALEGEPPSAIALILTCLEPTVAGQVMKGMPAEVRADIAMRYSQPGPRNFALVNQIAKAVAEKGNGLIDQPTEAVGADRIADLAAMLRGLPRAERLAVLQKIEAADRDLADSVKAKLFRFSDLNKIEDRPLQQMLTQLNLRTIATALKGADEAVAAKIVKNISARTRELLTEEMEMIGNVSQAKNKEAQDEILAVLRQYEEEGKVSLED
ncbi:FliG C-terminal domain-containing protein [Limnoglobus roseus]|uniref:Flagellar motor switch protein FliG n=1 Tax=Limnoglobus roseus TaxID=2598579 RepID=A0A5C1A830_9BACT|nr:FliG C-terminal domain-containing protein [Limnoglobus roseus]QEL13328.1 Flagellar motor switch protein FliG [Limnoglobus roseus]